VAGVRWLAGLLEGEGSFCFQITSRYKNIRYRSPMVNLGMCDEDVVRKASRYGRAKMYGPYMGYGTRQKKPRWQALWRGKDALELMLKVYRFMGARRKSRIQEVLALWEHSRGTERV